MVNDPQGAYAPTVIVSRAPRIPQKEIIYEKGLFILEGSRHQSIGHSAECLDPASTLIGGWVRNVMAI